MKRDLENLTYVVFDEEGLDDFKHLILPDVYEILFLSDDFLEDGIVTVGALVDNVPVGAAVAQVFEEDIVNLTSIYVEEEYRECGIGKGLLDSVLSEVQDTLSDTYDPELSALNLALRTEYVLPEDASNKFDAFLKSAGFTDIFELPTIYYFPEKLPEIDYTPEQVSPLDEMDEFEDGELEYYLRESGISPLDGCNFFAGTKEEVEALAVTSSSDLELFEIMTIQGNTEEDASENTFLNLLDTTMKKIRSVYPESRILINSEKNLYPNTLHRIADEKNVNVHKEAYIYVRF